MAYDQKLKRAKELACIYTRNLGEGDRVCVVSFDHIPEIALALSAKGDAPDISSLVERIHDRGSTNMALGLRRASEILAEGGGSIVLLSDGRANTTLDGGGTEGDELVESEILQIARELSEKAIAVSAISLGEDSFTSFLEKLAQITGGEFLVDVGGRLERAFDLRETEVIVHSVPAELPTGKPTWTKEMNTRHVTIASRELCNRFEESRVSFLLNPKNNKRARVSLLSIDDNQLAPFRDRQPKIATGVSESRMILVDRTYRRALGLSTGDVARLSTLQ